MIGLLLLIASIVSVGSAFYRLAHDHYRSEWPFALLGGGVFLVSQFVFGFIIGFVLAVTGNGELLTGTYQLALAVIIYAVAGLSCAILYYSLKKNWEKHPKNNKENNSTIDNF